MLTRLQSNNFKCLGSFDQDLAPLTLLTGFNAAGKSSVIQSLAILHQTSFANEWAEGLQLNGKSVSLGKMIDVIDRNAGGSGFNITLESGDYSISWEIAAEDRNRDLIANFRKITVKNKIKSWTWPAAKSSPLRCLVPSTIFEEDPDLSSKIRFKIASMIHLGADRLGPREVYTAESPLRYPDVGTQGEKTPLCLDQLEFDPINEGTRLEKVPPQVRLTVTAWMKMLFPGFGYEIWNVDRANLLTLGIRTSPTGDVFRISNVGFGISHVLPIVTACVAARQDSTVLIENPESHLHPAGQSKIGEFLACAASKGTQLLVETHSDHVLNGVRRSIRDGKISNKHVRILFFSSKEGPTGEPLTKVENIPIDTNGRITFWPDGFFDQIDSDLDHIHRQ